MSTSSKVVRTSVSMEDSLFHKLEALAEADGYANRSELIRDLIRKELVRREWEQNQDVVATLTLVFDHHRHGLSDRITDIQHHVHRYILCTTHVHLDEDLCAEVTIMRGPAAELRRIAGSLKALKGVLHAEVCAATLGASLR